LITYKGTKLSLEKTPFSPIFFKTLFICDFCFGRVPNYSLSFVTRVFNVWL